MEFRHALQHINVMNPTLQHHHMKMINQIVFAQHHGIAQDDEPNVCFRATSRLGLDAASGHRQRVFQQSVALTVMESKVRQVSGRAVAGLEAPVGVRPPAATRPTPLRKRLVVLELLSVVLEHSELDGGLGLHVLGRGVHGLVRARVVGFRGVGDTCSQGVSASAPRPEAGSLPGCGTRFPRRW